MVSTVSTLKVAMLLAEVGQQGLRCVATTMIVAGGGGVTMLGWCCNSVDAKEL
jgi:hypothetical protein